MRSIIVIRTRTSSSVVTPIIPNRQLASGDSKKSWLRISLAATCVVGGGGGSDSAVVVASKSVVVVGAAFLFLTFFVVLMVLPNCPSVSLPRCWGSCSIGRLIHRFAFFRGWHSCCSVGDGKSAVVLFVVVASRVWIVATMSLTNCVLPPGMWWFSFGQDVVLVERSYLCNSTSK